MFSTRKSGILLHPTSLPGQQPIGTLGKEAYDFIDWLVEANQSVWQILPLGPIGHGNCPYSCYSAFAGNPLLINFAKLVEAGDLLDHEVPKPAAASNQVNFTSAVNQTSLLRIAAERFNKTATPLRRQQFEQFCREQAFWLNDYCFFEAMRQLQQNRSWQQWPEEIRQRQEHALHKWGIQLQDEIAWHKYLQFIFFEQWFELKNYANSKGIEIFGDLPIFVAENSADVWTNRHLFHLDEKDQPTMVAGVPPDYFSKTGQRWGNPLYNWQRMAEDNYSWWLARFRWNLQLFDLIRVDHFRGFAACWAIPAEEETAVNGNWQKVPGEQLFSLLREEFNPLPIVAEDLGVITPDVEKLRDNYELPGMKILQFAFDSGPKNPYLPHNHLPNSVIYTGTHDNDTSAGWWSSLDSQSKQQVRNYLKRPCDDMPWALIEAALVSVAKLAIIPLQDILELDSSARMNRPGIAHDNWLWRNLPQQPDARITKRLQEVSLLYGRALCNPTETQ
ncbi:4-alpha-glucanotransferase [Malonomonas rubra DSM 5091]|uniref:4-alpha-glucanotransferase n=1 Tax=Malonomonas rubra DSM 5091 TaxID=1122189 RepID=A0A1M6J779_MALRU|nr:4-alpha-glucanotransferase [Malonomonas rubra]SHJ42487.1 4-alpha-glucanotransferase [Malonomonas rubra DSM 5091]